MWRHLAAQDGGGLDGRRVAIVGDVLHSRVARSNALLLRTLGAEVTLVAPPTLLPVGVEAWPVETSYDLDAVLPKADAVMMLRVQRERMHGGFFPTAREYSRRYGLDGRRMATLQDHTIVMHPGPMVRGMEITADVADSDRSVIVEQVTNGVAVRMAVLYLLLGGSEPAARPRGRRVSTTYLIKNAADPRRRADRPAARGRRHRRDRRRPRPPTAPRSSTPTGLVALPGLVDLHTHLREPGREDAETVESGTQRRRARRLHRRARDGQHRPGRRHRRRRRAGLAARPRGRLLRRLPGRRGHRRARRRAARRARRDGRLRRPGPGVLRRRQVRRATPC